MIRASRKWALAGAGAMFVGSLALGPVLRADTGTITVVRNASVVNGITGDIGGGEFCVTQFSGFGSGSLPPQGPNVRIGNCVFETFCLEGNEFIPDSTQLNWTDDSAAHLGGNAASPGGPASPGSDPLSPETAYIFSRFWDGSLPNYNFLPLGGTIPGANRRTSANDLQLAIWYLEDELLASNVAGPGGHLGWNYLSATAQAWVTDAFVQTAPGGTWFQTWGANSIGNVTVLVLTFPGGAPAQDVIALDPVKPPPPPSGGDGYTPGFWHNKNGQAAINAAIPSPYTLLDGLCLFNKDGSDFDPHTAADIGGWIQSDATNMAFKLSTMLACMELNVHVPVKVNGVPKTVDLNRKVYTKDCAAELGVTQISIGDLMGQAAYDLCLPTHNITIKASSVRTHQECLKNVLDAANNNQNWVP